MFEGGLGGSPTTIRPIRTISVLGGIASVLVGAIAPTSYARDQIIDIRNGSASIQRQGESRRRLAPVGTMIRTGDLVYPVRGTMVTVLCQNGVSGTRTRLFGLADVCPDSVSPRYSQAGRGEDDFRAFLEGEFEYASQVFEGNPRLRWNPAAGVTTYHVQMWDCGRAVFNCTAVIWEATVEGTAVRYGGEALELDRNYQLEVRAEDGPGQAPAYLTMRRLDEAQMAAVQTAVAQLDEADLRAEGKALALAWIYLQAAEPNTSPPDGAGLVLAAIPALEAVAPQSATPYVHRLLGDLYLQGGLLAAARQAYQATLDLTEGSADLASRAAARVGLANIAATEGDRLTAELQLRQARLSYTWLADGDRLAQVEDWLDMLSAID